MLRSVGWLNTNASGPSTGSIFKGQENLGPIGSHETSVLNQSMLRNIPENNRIQANRSESLRFPITIFGLAFQSSTALLDQCRCLFVFHNSICLYKHWLNLKLQPVITKSGNTLFTALVTAALKSTFIIAGDKKRHRFFSRTNKQRYLFNRYPVNVQTEPDMCSSHAICFREPCLSYKTERTVSDNF
jgi:hypothetical protein